MRLLITGVGDAFTRRHFGCGSLIDAPRGFVLIDCGDLIHRALHEATSTAGWNATAADIDDIILTHLHGDHCNGLESFGFLRRIMRLNNPAFTRPRLHVTAPVEARLWERLAPAMHAPMGGARPSTLDDFFEVHSIQPDQPANIAGLTVRCRFTRHPIPTIGLLLSDGAKSVGWSGDTPFEPDHIDWLRRADLIVHECNTGPAHTPISALNALPADVRSKMRLIHLPDDFDPRQTGIAILRQGDVLTP